MGRGHRGRARRADRRRAAAALPWVALLLAIVFGVGALFAFYHVGVEQHWFAGPSACAASGGGATTLEEMKRQILGTAPVLCDRVQWSLFGVSLAGWNLLASLVMAAICLVVAVRSHGPASQSGGMNPERPPYLPGDPVPEAEIESMIRVDHAGEYGAVRIYDGQLAVIGRGHARDAIRQMAEHEKRHLAAFDALVRARRVRPTLLHPLWHIAGYALGAASALLGERAAMACTVAVEEVIDEHYQGQAERLGEADPTLSETIETFRAEELAHRATAIEHGATEAPGYELISAMIKTGSRLAIWLSTRL